MGARNSGELLAFDAGAALLVGHRSRKDLLPPRALPQRQISRNAPVPQFLRSILEESKFPRNRSFRVRTVGAEISGSDPGGKMAAERGNGFTYSLD
jgi:hypothetical protein